MNDTPKVFRETLQKMKADGILDDPKFKTALHLAVLGALASMPAEPTEPTSAQLKAWSTQLSMRLGQKVSPVDLAAAFQHYGSQPSGSTEGQSPAK